MANASLGHLTPTFNVCVTPYLSAITRSSRVSSAGIGPARRPNLLRVQSIGRRRLQPKRLSASNTGM